MRSIFAAMVCLGTALSGAAQSLTVDRLDASDGFPLPPPHLIVFDAYLNVAPNDSWQTSGLAVRTSNGVLFQYAYEPNGDIELTAPGPDNRFVTFFSEPAGRDSADRFGPERAVLAYSYAGVCHDYGRVSLS